MKKLLALQKRDRLVGRAVQGRTIFFLKLIQIRYTLKLNLLHFI